jgi:FG-GAP repeat protein
MIAPATWDASDEIGAPTSAGTGDFDGDRVEDLAWYQDGALYVLNSPASPNGPL